MLVGIIWTLLVASGGAGESTYAPDISYKQTNEENARADRICRAETVEWRQSRAPALDYFLLDIDEIVQQKRAGQRRPVDKQGQRQNNG